MAERRYSPICRAVPSAVFSAMLPAKPSVTATSTVPLPRSSPSMKPRYSKPGWFISRRIRPASRTSSTPLISSTPTFRSADGRAIEAEDGARHRRAHHREVDQHLGVGADRRADVEHDALAAQRRPDRGDRRPLDAGQRLQAELRHRHQRAGIAGRDGGARLAVPHRLDRAPHRRLPAPLPQRLARLVVASARSRCNGGTRTFRARADWRPAPGAPRARRRRSGSADPAGGRWRSRLPRSPPRARCRPPWRRGKS